jgi:hypothetical protein
MRNYKDVIVARKARYGDFDPSDIKKDFIRYYETGERVRVRWSYPSGSFEDLTGTIGITTGWRPVFILMRTSRSIGSPYTLTGDCKVVAVQKNGKYISLEAL